MLKLPRLSLISDWSMLLKFLLVNGKMIDVYIVLRAYSMSLYICVYMCKYIYI